MLQPNCTYTLNGVKIREKIIPDGTCWQDSEKAKEAGFKAGDLYKQNQKLSGNAGTAKWVTIHNTGDFANVVDGGEQYTRATYNETCVRHVCIFMWTKREPGKISKPERDFARQIR